MDIELESIFCEECNDRYLFRLKDKNGEFTISLTELLRCIWFAQEVGAVPEISSKRWLDLRLQYDENFEHSN